MKKIILLLGIVIYSLSVKAQTLDASPTSVVSGNTVTLTGNGESSIAYFAILGSVVKNPNTANVTATVQSITYYNPATFAKTKVVVLLKNTTSQPITVSLSFPAVVNDDVTGNQNEFATAFVSQTITVKPVPPTIYYNTAVSATYTKQACGSGTMGSRVTYTVPANKYSASTQAAAQQLATNDLNANGQNYANAHGECIPAFARLEGTIDDGEGSHIVVHFYSDEACTLPFSLPSATSLNITYNKYQTDGTPYAITSVYSAAQGVTTLFIGEREFYTSLPPSTIHVDWVASVVLNSNSNFTAKPNYGTFTNN